MTYKFHTRLDLINGGNIFRQDDKITLGYIARNANGEAIDFSGKDIMGTIYNRRAGIMYEAEASFDAESQKIIFTITQTLDHGTFEIEFIATDPGDANYRVVIPSDEYSGRLDIKPSSANIEVTGVRMVTVEQLRSEQQSAQSTYEEKVDGKVQQLETGFTNHKNAVDLVVQDVQQKASAAETATQTANNAASAATSAASSANTAASSANEQAGAAHQAASDATAASTAANSSADRANTAAGNAEGIVDEFGTYKESAAKAKTFGTVDDRFEELERDGFFPTTNKVRNGNFANGTTSWVVSGVTSSVADQSLMFAGAGTVNSMNTAIFQTSVFTLNDLYYVKVDVKRNNEQEEKLFVVRQGYGSPNALTLTADYQPFSFSIRATDNVNSSGDRIAISAANGLQVSIKNIIALNLTAVFGAGNEPTKEEMDALLAFYPSSWFDGKVNLAENKKFVKFLLNQLRSKANKKQEAWITPTLINGWTAYNTAATPIGYKKSTTGRVQLRGRYSGGSAIQIFTLPPGYRTGHVNNFIASSNSGPVQIEIAASGNVSVTSGTAYSWVSLDDISFQLE